MTKPQIISGTCVVAGFIVGALISEFSLRGATNEARGALLAAFSKLRLMHLGAVVALVGLGFVVPVLFWPAAIAYFALATILAIVKLRTLQLPDRCKQLQALSVASVFIGLILAGVVSWLA